MLERLNEINWSELHTAYGSADNVSGWIRDLSSPEPATWSEALSALRGTILHQGSIYSATTAAVPFLIELLATPAVHCRGHILRFLAEVAGTNSHVDMLWRRYGRELLDVDAYEHSLRRFWDEEVKTEEHIEWGELHYILEELEQDAKDEERRQIHTEVLITEHQAKAAVWHGLEIYFALLDDPDLSLRLIVPCVFGKLAEGASRTASTEAGSDPWSVMSQAMIQRLECEPNPIVKASLVLGLNAQSEQRPENLQTLRALLRTPLPPPMHLAVIWCLSERGESLSEQAIVFLADLLKTSEGVNSLFDIQYETEFDAVGNNGSPIVLDESQSMNRTVDFPWWEGNPYIRSVSCLCRLGAEHLPLIQDTLLAMLERADQFTRITPILEYLFPPNTLPPSATMADLSFTQRRALFTLYNNSDARISEYEVKDLCIPPDYDEWGVLPQV